MSWSLENHYSTDLKPLPPASARQQVTPVVRWFASMIRYILAFALGRECVGVLHKFHRQFAVVTDHIVAVCSGCVLSNEVNGQA